MQPKTPRTKLVQLVEAATLADSGWAAAVDVDGSVFTAECHADAWGEFYDATTDLDIDSIIDKILSRDMPPDSREGFVSPEGTFLTREQALSRWRSERGSRLKLSDDDTTRDWGDSNDLQM